MKIFMTSTPSKNALIGIGAYAKVWSSIEENLKPMSRTPTLIRKFINAVATQSML
jgi:hypothetical protein